jgi:hypothetical protein
MVTINSITVTDTQINDLVTKLRRWALAAIDWTQFDKYEFQGFNPETTVASFISLSKKMNLADGILEKDIITLVGIGIMKGNVTVRNKKRMSEEGIKAFDELVARYGIEHSAKEKSATTITIPRTVAAYAGLAVRMVDKMGPKKYPGKSFRSTELPAFMQITCFPSIIPSNLPPKISEFLLIGNLCYSMDLTITVKNISDVKEIEKLIDEQRKFVDLAYASSIPTLKSRQGLVTELKLDTFYKQITEAVNYYKLFKTDYVLPSLPEFTAGVQSVFLTPAGPSPAAPPAAPIIDE